jgi:adenylate cyclase
MVFLIHRLESTLARMPSVHVRWAIIAVLIAVLFAKIFSAEDQSRLVGSSYDTLTRNRVLGPAVDPAILIVDIDEASLAIMSKDYGRWPWPRDTLASVLDFLERNGAQAVVFDILFADKDVLNPMSDLAFADSVTQSRRSYFPVLRLESRLDQVSEVRANMLPGFAIKVDNSEPQQDGSEAGPPMAVIPPVFSTITQSGRLGFHNIYPDVDGVNRQYRLWEDIAPGWRLLSLPARLAVDLGWSMPTQANQILALPLETAAYPSVSFHDLWQASQARAAGPLADQVKGKIVIIGSTAPNLFDVKVTPLSPIHPGVHVLAGAIDNVKNGNFLKMLDKGWQLVIGVLLLLAMAQASARLPLPVLRWGILVAPTVLIGLSYVSLNVGGVFVDLTAVASQAFVFFTATTVYAAWRVGYFATIHIQDEPPKTCQVLVIDAGPVKMTVNQLIDAGCAAWGSSFCVVQSGFTSGVSVGASGPFCIFVLNCGDLEEGATRQLLGVDEKNKITIFTCDAADLLAEGKPTTDAIESLAWRFLSKAMVGWNGGT